MFEKYLKYKKKYLALKGGFALSQECYREPYYIDAETGDKELKEEFLYPKMKKYFEDNIEFYNKYLKIINDYSKSKGDKKPSVHDVNNIINYFESDRHNQILIYLLDKFIEDNLINYHVQYTSLIFLSFILELELFMVCYSIVPYNTIREPDNNNLNIEWKEGDKKEKKPTYYKLLDSDIISLFNKYTCSLELIYKIYIDTLIENLIENKNSAQILQIKNIFYKDKKINDYRHINHDWINKLIIENIFDDNAISILIKKTLKENKFNYNPMINGLFDLIFTGFTGFTGFTNFEASCITYSIIEFYYLSRSHINYESLYLNLETGTNLKCILRETLQESLNTPFTHWSCSCMNVDIREIYKDKIKLTFKNKDEIFISFIFFTYDLYYYYFRFRDIPQYLKFRKFIRKKQKFLLNKLYTVKKLFFASMKKNPTQVWKNTDHNIKFELLKQGLETNQLQYTDIPLNIILEGLKTNQLLYTDIPLKIILECLRTKNLIYSDISEDLKLKIFSAITEQIIRYTEVSNDIIYEGLNKEMIPLLYISDNIIFEGLNKGELKYKVIPINIILEGLNEYELKYEDVPINIIFEGLNNGKLNYKVVPINIIFEGLNNGKLQYVFVPIDIIFEGLKNGKLQYVFVPYNILFKGLNKRELKYENIPFDKIFEVEPFDIIFEGLNNEKLNYKVVPINIIFEGLKKKKFISETLALYTISESLKTDKLKYEDVPSDILLKVTSKRST
jgi:hypothetical protein